MNILLRLIERAVVGVAFGWLITGAAQDTDWTGVALGAAAALCFLIICVESEVARGI